MINAAIVGLGWWGKTLVESAANSESIRFVAGATRTVTPEIEAFAKQHGLRLLPKYDAVLADREADAMVLATPHSLHGAQVVAAAGARKHVFCEKPFTLTKREAEDAVAAVRKAGVTLALGYNRRLHPEMIKLRDMIRAGELGTILHIEATMTFPNVLFINPSHCRAATIDADDTTSILFRMKAGMSGYLGTMTTTGPGFSFQVFGSKGWLRLEGMTHVAGASSDERRTRLLGTCKHQPAQGDAQVWQAAALDIRRAALEAFAKAAEGGPAYPISHDEMIHGVAVTEAIVRSAAACK